MARGSRRHTGGRKSKTKRAQRPSFHIFCEGKNTEPLYFNSFPISNIGHCKGYGRSKTSLVDLALDYKRKNGINKKSSDQIWVVFDYDFDGKKQPGQKEDYNNAIIKAEKNNIRWAVSNDSFELWYVLHFQRCNAQQLRPWYNERLKYHAQMKYDKDRETAKKMYDLLLEKQPQALKRAEMLAAQYDRNNKSHADKNPFTTVYELVNELNKHVKS